MKKLLILPLLLLLITGCDNNTFEKSDKDTWIYFYTDEETCVEYVIYNDGYSGGITPRLNADGTLKLNEECLKNAK